MHTYMALYALYVMMSATCGPIENQYPPKSTIYLVGLCFLRNIKMKATVGKKKGFITTHGI